MTEIKPPEETDTGYHSDFLDEDFELFSVEKPCDFEDEVVRIIGVERDEHEEYGAFLRIIVEIEEGMFTNQLYNEDKPSKELRQFCTDFGFTDTDELTEESICDEKILIKPNTAFNRKSKEYRKFFDEEGNELYFVNFDYMRRVKGKKDKKKKKAGKKGKKSKKAKTKACPICKEDIDIDDYSDHVDKCDG